MSPDLKTCEEKALKLPLKERAALAEHLIASLDGAEEAENERLWAEEAEQRYHAYKEGKITVRPAVDAIREARSGR
ncbi:MAG: addiction module protein [Candidatus Aureabacteria bacterium]|nr:addiction module protein [Candidatus Auribacterota bacterium]